MLLLPTLCEKLEWDWEGNRLGGVCARLSRAVVALSKVMWLSLLLFLEVITGECDREGFDSTNSLSLLLLLLLLLLLSLLFVVMTGGGTITVTCCTVGVVFAVVVVPGLVGMDGMSLVETVTTSRPSWKVAVLESVNRVGVLASDGPPTGGSSES